MRVLRPDVEPPTLSRQALQELQAVLVGVLDEIEEARERRPWDVCSPECHRVDRENSPRRL